MTPREFIVEDGEPQTKLILNTSIALNCISCTGTINVGDRSFPVISHSTGKPVLFEIIK